MKLSKSEREFVEALSSLEAKPRKARNISLDDEQYERFQDHCAKRGLAPNKVIDALIGMFLEGK
jgi:predicted metal-dependent hydrolase